MRYQGKTALITGASSGIGLEFAKRLAKRGCTNIVLVARRRDRLEELAAALQSDGKTLAHVCDVDLAQPGAASAIRQFVETQRLAVDILINNAGFGTYGHFVEQNAAREAEEIQVNIQSLVALTHEFLPGMKERKEGAIVNLGSVAGFLPIPKMAVYAATKAFVLSFSVALHAEMKPHSVRVICVAPGPVETEFHSVAGNASRPGMETVEHCVSVAFAGLDANQSYVVTGGLSNRLSAGAGSLLPRDFVAKTAMKVMSKK